MGAFFYVLDTIRISPSPSHSSLPPLTSDYNPSQKLLTQLRTLTNFLRKIRLRYYIESFMGARTFRNSSYEHP